MKLCEERRLDPFAGLVARPQIIAERFYDVVRGDTEVSFPSLEHLQNGGEHADDGAVRAVDAFVESAQSIEVTEELVSPIDQVNDHRGAVRESEPHASKAWRLWLAARAAQA